MGYDTKISSNAREQLEQFLGVFYTRFSKPRLKFLRQMLYVVRVAKRCSGRGALVLAVAYFVMVWIGKSERREVLRTHIVETAKRIYGAPEFFYYAHPC